MEFLNSIFLPMLAGHFIADFWLQPSSWVLQKKEKRWKSKKLLIHSLLCAFFPVLFTFNLNLWWFVLVIFGTHYLIDLLKSKFEENIPTFLIDQLLHIFILWLLTFYFSTENLPVFGGKFWIYVTGFVLVTNPFGILTGLFFIGYTVFYILKLDEMGVPGVIAGKAIYENRISLKEIEVRSLSG